MLNFASSQDTASWLIESTFLISRPLRSTATPASSDLTATTGRSAGKRRTGTQCLRFSASARSLSRPSGHAAPGSHIGARLLTFHAKAADRTHAASTPDTTWPIARAPARLFPKAIQGPPVSMPTKPFDASTATPDHATRPGQILDRLPGPHLTQSTPRLLPVAHHDGLQPTQHRVV